MNSLQYQNPKFEPYLHLVDQLVKPYRYSSTVFELSDLRQEGYLCLCEALSESNTGNARHLKTHIKTRLQRLWRYQTKPYKLLQKLLSAGFPVAQMPDAINAEFVFFKKVLEDGLEKLEPKQSKVLRMFFGINCKSMKITEIALILGITPQAARGLRRRGYKKLLENQSLQDLAS